jgi:hypothetical protein
LARYYSRVFCGRTSGVEELRVEGSLNTGVEERLMAAQGKLEFVETDVIAF